MAPLHRLRILVVDDDADNRALMEMVLASEGFGTVLAEGGDQAIAAARRHQPGLVLLDVMMPEMDGFTVLERLKAEEATRDIPVIMVTCLQDRHTKQRAVNCGASGLIGKPVDRSELAAAIEQFVGVDREPVNTEATSR